MKFAILTYALLAVPVLSGVVAPPEDALEAVPVLSGAVAPPEDALEGDLEARAQRCQLKLQWKTNFKSGGRRRYRVQLITTPRNDAHLTLFCNHLKHNTPGHMNVQCYWKNGQYVIDSTHAVGPAGHSIYKKKYNQAAVYFKEGTNCNVIQNT